MSEIDNALDRLGEAVSGLITATERGRDKGGDKTDARIDELTAERNSLRAEVDKLHALREDDSRLRAEAADAVKDALKDLRSLVATKEKAK